MSKQQYPIGARLSPLKGHEPFWIVKSFKNGVYILISLTQGSTAIGDTCEFDDKYSWFVYPYDPIDLLIEAVL